MRSYNFLVDGIRVRLYSPIGAEICRREVTEGMADGELAVVIRPDSGADFTLDCFDKIGVEPGDPYLALVTLAHFFRAVRGLPAVSFDVAYHGKTYEAYIGNGGEKFLVNVGKCKLLCTKTADFADGVTVCADVILGDYRCVATVCADSDLFGEERLSGLGRAVGEGLGVAALAASFDCALRVKTFGDIPYYDALTVAALALARHGASLPRGRLTAYVNGRCYTLSRSGEVLTFYPNIKYLY